MVDAEMLKKIDEIREHLEMMHQAINKRFENLKKIIGDYLELSSSIAIGSVKTNLKNV